MDARDRVLAGTLGGVGATLVLSGLRWTWHWMGLVFDTAPTQVVDRVEEVFTQEGFSPATRRVLAAVAHVGYGVSTGAAFGLLRRNTGGRNVEAAVGSSLGVLAWGAGWAAAHRRPFAPVGATDHQGPAARDRPRGLRGRLGFNLLRPHARPLVGPRTADDPRGSGELFEPEWEETRDASPPVEEPGLSGSSGPSAGRGACRSSRPMACRGRSWRPRGRRVPRR